MYCTLELPVVDHDESTRSGGSPLDEVQLTLLQQQLYEKVIDDVLDKIAPAFYDEGRDDQVLKELKEVGRGGQVDVF